MKASWLTPDLPQLIVSQYLHQDAHDRSEPDMLYGRLDGDRLPWQLRSWATQSTASLRPTMEKYMNALLGRLHVILGLAFGLLLLFPYDSSANERQACLNRCTQDGATQHKKCQADHEAEMIRCGTLETNQARNDCKRQAIATLKTCNSVTREQVKLCKSQCPPKK